MCQRENRIPLIVSINKVCAVNICLSICHLLVVIRLRMTQVWWENVNLQAKLVKTDIHYELICFQIFFSISNNNTLEIPDSTVCFLSSMNTPLKPLTPEWAPQFKKYSSRQITFPLRPRPGLPVSVVASNHLIHGTIVTFKQKDILSAPGQSTLGEGPILSKAYLLSPLSLLLNPQSRFLFISSSWKKWKLWVILQIHSSVWSTWLNSMVSYWIDRCACHF